ncbi:MAG: hypothetical protein ABIX12_04105 [Rubrivivax sp.]
MAQREEVSDSDIHFSRLSGLAPADVDILSDFTREEGLLLVIRCPKRPARYFQGRAAPKPPEVERKSNPATGLVRLDDGRVYVSDYDLMCVWRDVGRGEYDKVYFSAPDPAHPKLLSSEARALLDKVNDRLKAPFQHGAQDDFHSPKNPNVQMRTAGGNLVDRFLVFDRGAVLYVCNGAELKQFYDRRLGPGAWPYDERGRHTAARG